MKNLPVLIFITILSIGVPGQKRNTINCKITYLPSIRYEDKSVKISKIQAKKIDSLINLKSYKINLTDDDLEMLKELYDKKDFSGNKMYPVSESAFLKLTRQKEINIDPETIRSLSEKSVTDLLSSVVDGSPFILTASTKNNRLTYKNNFSGIPGLKGLNQYLIFYFIYHEVTFCQNGNKLVSSYFERQNLMKNIMYFLVRMEAD